MEITEYNKCVGCSLCSFVCPTGAITMKKSDDLGFMYPIIDLDKCIKCNKCKLYCPSNSPVKKNISLEYLLAQNKKIEELIQSTSGGISSSISKSFVKNGGVVYGAAFNDCLKVSHIRCTTVTECERIKGSKYVQSDISEIYSLVLKDLENKNKVLFIGTPCQCAAMKQVFNKYCEFYCCDFVCNGVGSPDVFKQHINYLDNKYHSEITNYVFRPKTCYYLEPFEVFENKSGYIQRIKSPWEKWGTLYYNGLVMRESCFYCDYTSLERIGNITFSDIPSHLINSDDVKFENDIRRFGASYISVNEKKGEYLLSLIIENIEYKKTLLIPKKRMTESIERYHNRDVFSKYFSKSIEISKLKTLGLKLKIKSFYIKLFSS